MIGQGEWSSFSGSHSANRRTQKLPVHYGSGEQPSRQPKACPPLPEQLAFLETDLATAGCGSNYIFRLIPNSSAHQPSEMGAGDEDLCRPTSVAYSRCAPALAECNLLRLCNRVAHSGCPALPSPAPPTQTPSATPFPSCFGSRLSNPSALCNQVAQSECPTLSGLALPTPTLSSSPLP